MPCGAFRILIPLRLPDTPLSRIIVQGLPEDLAPALEISW
ncbi:hypothetical protein ASZ90_014801 [hydrocarbon metagenome]|uniref:Uncharacterized protein n=1 Tax=hydrocarbon metagenome TaxID=938273 RepID=A0A0W8F3S9_9ZZZZ